MLHIFYHNFYKESQGVESVLGHGMQEWKESWERLVGRKGNV